MDVVRMILPTPYPVGPVNSYLIKESPYTLLDPGPDTEEARKLWEKQLRKAGVRLEDVERIILTHGHGDHGGLAGWLKKRTGAVLYAHPYESRKMYVKFNMWEEIDEFLVTAGVPEKELIVLHRSRRHLPPNKLVPQDIIPLWGGETLRCGEDHLIVLHMPGHAVGHLCFFALNARQFWAGDFLLPDITPNPIMERDPGNDGKRSKSLIQYLTGLDRLENMDIKMVWPGHGDPFTDVQTVVKQIRQHHDRRMKLILRAIPPKEKLTPYQITLSVFPNLHGYNVYLGLSEVMAYLDVLSARHLVAVEEKEKIMVHQYA